MYIVQFVASSDTTTCNVQVQMHCYIIAVVATGITAWSFAEVRRGPDSRVCTKDALQKNEKNKREWQKAALDAVFEQKLCWC